MKNFSLIGVCLLICATAATGQTITVRSGDHETFSRLVMDIPLGTAWTLKRRGRGATLTLDLETAFFETNAVFTRISKSRLNTLTASGPVLELNLGCECSVRASLQSETMLVVDIADAPTPPPETLVELTPATPPEATQEATAVQPERRFGYGELLWKTKPDPVVEKEPQTVKAEADTSQSVEVKAETQTLPEVQDAVEIWQIEEKLLVEIGKAATRGLLDPNLALGPAEQPGDGSDGPHAEADKPSAPDHALDGRENVRTYSGIETREDPDQDSVVPEDGYVCPNDALIAVQDWGDTSRFGDQIGHWRSGLSEEFDRLNRTAALGLARNYVYFGFGIEARRTLALDGDLIAENAMLVALTDIVDGAPLEPHNALIHFTGCDSDIAFWAILAQKTLPKTTALNVDAALRTLNKLPVHLRIFLGPVLSNRLLEAGDIETANDVLRNVARAQNDPDSDLTMAQANIALETHQVDQAQDKLQSVISENTAASPVALIKLVDSKMEQFELISPQTATLAAAYAHEYRDTDLGPDLRRIHVLARSRSNQFDVAFDALDRLRKRDGSVSSRKLRSQVLGILAENADDITFLRFALPQSQTGAQAMDSAVANAMAARFLDLGFAQPALLLVAKDTTDKNQNARQILRARIALMQHDPSGADAELIGASGPDATMLRAQARAMAGDFQTATQLYETLNLETKAAEAAWLSSDWDHPLLLQSPLFKDAALLMQRNATGHVDDTGPEAMAGILAADHAMLSESQSTRVLLRSLLDAQKIDSAVGKF